MAVTQAEFPDTIFALATPSGRSGVAVIRVSGPHAAAALMTLSPQSEMPNPRHASLRVLHHPQTKEQIDQALVLYFPKPHSFTGEDVVELHTHGSRAILTEMLAALGELPGLRMASPGEFSRRAFYHQKFDLAEIEGMADLIDAETQEQKRQALRVMGGAFSEQCLSLRASLLKTLAYAEAFLDFPDEDLPASAVEEMEQEMKAVAANIQAMLGQAKHSRAIREGYRIALLGIPNAGKSSLLNALAERDAAIVTEIAGTTRDILEVRLNLSGYLVIVADTAGLRETSDMIELEGIRRAKAYAEEAELRLWLIDPSQEDVQQHDLLDSAQPYDLIIHTKCDLKQMPYTAKNVGYTAIDLSAKTGAGMERLLSEISTRIISSFENVKENSLITRQRHVNAFNAALAHLEIARIEQDLTLRAESLRLAIRSLSTVIGIVGVDDILDVVFSAFCLGK